MNMNQQQPPPGGPSTPQRVYVAGPMMSDPNAMQRATMAAQSPALFNNVNINFPGSLVIVEVTILLNI